MKSKFKLLVFLCALVSFRAFSQTIQPDYNNYNFKIGLKFIADKSNDNNLTPYRTTVYSFGVPISYKFNNSKSSIESGLYIITKAIGITEEESAILRNISLPVNYRMDFKCFYSTAGIYFDYLLSTENYNSKIFSDGKYSLREFNIGFNLNIGLEINFIKQYNVFIEARALSNITSSFVPNPGDTYGIFSYGAAVGVNYIFLHKN